MDFYLIINKKKQITGAQFGTIVSMPLSGLLSEYGFDGGWPSIFYVFGLVGAIWCIAFLMMVSEDPESDKNIQEDEKKYIVSALWGTAGASVNNFVYFFFFFFSYLIEDCCRLQSEAHY